MVMEQAAATLTPQVGQQLQRAQLRNGTSGLVVAGRPGPREPDDLAVQLRDVHPLVRGNASTSRAR